MLLKWDWIVHGSSVLSLGRLSFLQGFDSSNVLIFIIAFLFWIFFSWLRAAYLLIIANSLYINGSFQSVKLGLKKLISFLLVELLQVLMLAIGLMLLVFSPYFAAKYFAALPSVINQNDGAIAAMFESREYTRGQIRNMICSMFFIFIIIAFGVLLCTAITRVFIANDLIFLLLNFFLFSFFFLPLHSCYRFLAYERLQNATGDLKFEVTFFEKLWFVMSRIIILFLLVLNVLLVSTGVFDKWLGGVFN